MMRSLLWVPLALATAVLGLAAVGLRKPEDHLVHSAMIGKPLPPLALAPLLSDRPGIATRALVGRPRLLNIFASWCIPCMAEAPQLMRLRAAGVEIDAIAVRDTPAAVRAFLERNGDPYARIGSDPQSAAQLTLGSSGVPETFVLDSRGQIVAQHIGDIRADDVAELLAALRSAS